MRNDIGAGVIGWRRVGILNLAKKLVRFYAIIMSVTLNCQLSKLVNTFFQYVDQKLLSPKTGKLKKKKPTRIRLKVAPSNGFRHVLLCLGVTLYCIIV